MANGNGNGVAKSSPMVEKMMTALAGGAVGVLITFMTAVNTQSEELAALTTKIENLEYMIQSNMNDRYRGADARRDLQLRDQRIRSNEEHIKELQGFHRMGGASN